MTTQYENKAEIKIDQSLTQHAKDSGRLLESAIISNLRMTPEQRIEAHENARQLMFDLMEAGKAYYAAQSQSTA